MMSKPGPVHGVVVGVIAMYWTISILMVFMNKHIMSGAFGSEDLTIFSAWYQCSAAVGCVLCMAYTSGMCGISLKLPSIEPKLIFSKNMIVLSMSSVAALTFNNLMLKHIGVAFYQVARSFTIVFTIFLSSLLLKKSISWKASFSCMLVVVGFFIGIDQEDASGTLSVFGIIYGLLASLSAAICGIYFKKAESTLDGDSLKQAFYNNLNSCMIFFPLVFSSGQFTAVVNSDFKFSLKFWLLLTVAGCLSLAIGWVSAMQIKYTSPVSHHLSINAKSVVQTVMAVLIYHESKTFLWWLGNMFVVLGILLYTLSRIHEDRNSAPALPVVKNSG